MIDRPVLRYHGGKYRLAEWVISHFPPHECYLEPYSGAASVLMQNAARLITISFMGQGSQGTTRNYRTGFRCQLRNHDHNALPSHEWATYPSSIPAFVERLQGVAIENTDALKVIRRLDSPDTLIYADPPYVTATRGRSYANKGYRHEMTDADHEELARALHTVTGMVVLSGYPSPLYDRLYAGWQRSECDATADRGKAATEVVWMNEACVRAHRQPRLIA